MAGLINLNGIFDVQDIRNGLSVQPDLQYVQTPYGRSDLDDAVVVGLRLKTDLMALR